MAFASLRLVKNEPWKGHRHSCSTPAFLMGTLKAPVTLPGPGPLKFAGKTYVCVALRRFVQSPACRYKNTLAQVPGHLYQASAGVEAVACSDVQAK